MITEITEETTVKEIIEVLEFIEKFENSSTRIELWSDISGGFTKSGYYDQFIEFSDLPEYIKKHIEPDCDEILEDPEAKEKIIRSLPITDLINEMLRREKEKK